MPLLLLLLPPILQRPPTSATVNQCVSGGWLMGGSILELFIVIMLKYYLMIDFIFMESILWITSTGIPCRYVLCVLFLSYVSYVCELTPPPN